jgi:hypothetical protein
MEASPNSELKTPPTPQILKSSNPQINFRTRNPEPETALCRAIFSEITRRMDKKNSFSTH